jgi:predicted nucleotidyltransferase
MNPLLDQHRKAIGESCRRFHVRKLSVFGSVLRDDFGAESDVDLLVEFERHPGLDAFSQFFGLKEELEATIGRPIDLVSAEAIRNPVFRSEVERTRAHLYEAA